MATPIELEPGGKKTTQRWEFFKGAVDTQLIAAAGAACLQLLDRINELECVNRSTKYRQVVRIGIQHPRGAKDKKTVLSCPELTALAEPIVAVADVLRDTWDDLLSSDVLTLLTYHDFDGIGLHQDLTHQPEPRGRAVVGLLGEGDTFLHEPANHDIFSFRQQPGDAYHLVLTDDPVTSPFHAFSSDLSPRMALVI